jgi:hypothetical protein
MAAKKSKSIYVVRTDAVIASSKPRFYGEKVKLSEEEAKPLLRKGRCRKKTFPPHLERVLEPGPRKSPEQRENQWRIVWPAVARLRFARARVL